MKRPLLMLVFCFNCLTVAASGNRCGYGKLSADAAKWVSLFDFTYNTTCAGDTVFFTITGNPPIDSVKWDFGDPLSANADTSSLQRAFHIFSAPQAYPVRLIVFSGANTDTTVKTISIVNKIIYDLGPDTTLCEGDSILLSAPSIPGATYIWQDNSTNPTFLAKTEGTYKVAVNGCEIPDSVNVFFTKTPHLNLGPDLTMCSGQSIMLNATNQNATYQWNTGDTTANISITKSGQYKVVENITGCGIYQDSINILFTGPQVPFHLANDTTLCEGETVTLDPVGANPSWKSDNYLPTGFRWNTGAATPAITVGNAGFYWVFVNINNTCEVTDTMQVNKAPLQKINLGNDTTLCRGNFVILSADYGSSVNYLWQDSSKQATYFVRAPGGYYVTAYIDISPQHRCISSDTINVAYEDSLKVRLGPDTTLCNGERIVLFPNGAGNNYKWQDSSNAPQYVATTTGIYSVTAVNACGVATDSVSVNFENCNCDVFVPNSFTPNGDGVNDYFRPRYRCNIVNYQFRVYNRWGELLFSTNDPSKGWNGLYRGIGADMGGYVWYMRYADGSSGKKYFRSGSVLLIR